MFSKILNLIFPRTCINCQTPGDYLCKTCKKLLMPHPEICPYCHKFSSDYQTCLDCRTNKSHYLEGLIVAFSYQKFIKKLILQLKYYHKSDVANFLIERLALAIESNQILNSATHFPRSATLKIAHIPSHRFRHYFIKGYNQSKLLAQKLAKKLGYARISAAQKTRSTHTQAGLDRNQRLTNLNNAFRLSIQNIKESDTILIVDDVTTTGSTINELAKTIKSQFPKAKIRGIVLARNNR